MTAESTVTVGVLRVPWNDGRCIFCTDMGHMTDGHEIPRAVGSRLSAALSARRALGWWGVGRAQAGSDPAMRLAVEALGDERGVSSFRARYDRPGSA